MPKSQQTIGYLPDERPPVWKLILYALQQVIVMFPATVAVALITGFHISTTIFASGLATICFILVTRGQIPLYYGSSFSYIAAIGALMASDALKNSTLNEKIAVAQFGIIMSGLVSIAAGLIVTASAGFDRKGAACFDNGANRYGHRPDPGKKRPSGRCIHCNRLDRHPGRFRIPGCISKQHGLDYRSCYAAYYHPVFGILKGVRRAASVIAGSNCRLHHCVYHTSRYGNRLVQDAPESANAGIFAFPIFTLPKPTLFLAAIMPVAIATIPESTAHVYQLDIYVNDLAKKKTILKKYNIADKLGLNLIGDGIGDIVSGFVGGPAGTNYGENISAMAITKVFSVPVLVVASIIAMVIACFTPLVNAIYSLPFAVIGGLEIYLFGAIAAQGIAIMVEKKVDLFSSKNIALIATIMIIGLGGQYAFNGNIPIFGLQVPCVAGAAIFGIILNLILSIGEKKAE